MRFLIFRNKRRTAGLAGACALVLGAAVGVAAFGAGAAGAATCDAGAACAATGTATVGAGALSLTAPGTLTWGAITAGAASTAVDAVPADESLTVDDASGSGAGWNVSLTATAFTSGANVLPTTGTFSVNGSVGLVTDATAPGDACTVAGDCTLPAFLTAPVTYPVPVTTDGTTPAIIYTADATTGVGSIALGLASAGAPIGYWITVPGTALAGGYASTINLAVAYGP